MVKDPYERLESFLPQTDELGIDGYETIAPIGEGGFGRVFRARQAAFARDVAIKVLAAGGMEDETVRRFERECRAIGTLSGHPNIVTIYDSGISRWGRPYIVMDYITGGSFGDLLRRGERVDPQTATDAIVKIAGAVETAHRAGILHRDIKPENILLSGYGEPKLADFGVASIPGGYQTHTGAITASLAHAAPETLEGEKPTRAVDVYALGSTLFALIDGRPAFGPTQDGGLQSLVARTLTQPVPDLRPNGVPDGICEVIEKAMAKDPNARYASVEAFAAALQNAQISAGWAVTDLPIEHSALVTYPPEPAAGPESRTQIRHRRELTPPQPVPAPKREVWRSPLLAATIVLLLAIGSGGVIVLRARDRTQPAPAAAPAGEPTEPLVEADPEDDPETTGTKNRPRSRTEVREPAPKKPPERSGGALSFTAAAGENYSSSVSGGEGSASYPPGAGGSEGEPAGSGGGTSGGGGGADSQSKPPPQPVGSSKPADLAFWYHWNDDGSYFFTTDFESSQQAFAHYQYRAKLGEVWSSSATGDDLTPLCLTPDRCEGHVAQRPPREGNYLTLYWHGGGEHGRFFSTDPSATYRGQPLSVYGYIRP